MPLYSAIALTIPLQAQFPGIGIIFAQRCPLPFVLGTRVFPTAYATNIIQPSFKNISNFRQFEIPLLTDCKNPAPIKRPLPGSDQIPSSGPGDC